MDERDQEESGDDTEIRHAGATPAWRRLSRKPSLHGSANGAPRGGQIAEGAAPSSVPADEQGDAESRHETDKQFHLELLEGNGRLLAVVDWRAVESGNTAGEKAPRE